jgi:Na+/melibiose symporter-like transporter
LAAIVALITKVWDAINDPIFGMIMDNVNFKKGKFLPWLRISVIAIPVATILLFTIPTGIPMMAKIIWATLAYMLWDTAYTLCDVPIFGIVTTMTIDQKERISLNSIGRTNIY